MLGSIERSATFASLDFMAVFVAVGFVWAREAEKTSQKVTAYVGGGLTLVFVIVVVWLSQNRLSDLLTVVGKAI